MVIGGLQKLTLLDYPGKTACTVFTVGCNFRCPFCHNSSLVNDEDTQYIDSAEVLEFLSKRKGLLDGVCITGGEPLLQKDLDEFIKEIKTLGFLVKLDTNGSFPDRLKMLLDEKLLDYVAVDLKNCEEKYSRTIGVENFDYGKIQKSIEILRNSGVEYEFRTTVFSPMHDTESIEKITSSLKRDEHYFIQKFKDSGALLGTGCSEIEEDKISEFLTAAKRNIDNVKVRG